MAFTWTAPDPLDGTAKTLSIYITELQDAVNIRRAEIGQTAIAFIDASVGKAFLLRMVEQLKIYTNQLAIDFGYPSGVQDSALLGRPYSIYGVRYGKFLASYPIINDLRIVLDLLEEQFIYEDPGFVTVDWLVTQGAGSGNPDAFANFEIVANPFANQALDLQTAVGTTCPEGPPTCDNTIAGVFRGTFCYATDRTIIYYHTTQNAWVEGPIGEGWNEIPGFGGSTVFDDVYFYDFGGSEVGTGPLGGGRTGVQRWKRDGSSTSKETIALFDKKFIDYAGSGEQNTWGFLAVDANNIYVTGNKSSAGSSFRPVKAIYGRAVKTTASTIPTAQFYYDINACQAVAGPIGTFGEFPDQNIQSASIGIPFAKNGNIYVAYWDRVSYLGVNITNGRFWYVGSCIAEITQTATGGIGASGINLLDTSTAAKEHVAFPFSGPFFELRQGTTLKGQSNSYLWHNRRPNTLQEGRLQDGTIINPITPQTMYFSTNTYGANVSNVLQDLNATNLKHLSALSIDTSEAYSLRGGSITADITVPAFTTSSIVEGSPNDTIHVEWPATPGTFTYQVLWGTSSTSVNFVKAAIDSDTGTLQADITVTHGFNHYVKLRLLTGLGTITGDETLFFPVPVPPAPILLSVFPDTNSGELGLTWTTGSPFVLTNGFTIVYKKVGDPTWTPLDVGLSPGVYTITGLIPGASYDVTIKAYNDSGDSPLSNLLTGAAAL